MNEKELRQYIGHSFQHAGAMRITIPDGKASGSKAILMENSSGLSMIVTQDRCLDIYSLKINGKHISFLSKAGIVHPSFYDANQHEWLRNFGAGFLTTCGLTQVGEPCRFEGADFGLHGRISNTPAEDIKIEESDEFITVSGRVHQYKFQFEDIALYRSIRLSKSQNSIEISSRFINEGWKKTPFMILFHFNFGYPLLNPDTVITLPKSKIKGWDSYSSSCINEHKNITAPDAEYTEQTFIHEIKGDRNSVSFSISDRQENPDINVLFEYNAEHLPYITQWKYFKPGEYVMAIEPCNNHVKGVEWESKNGTLDYLLPGEERQIDFNVTFGQ